MGVIYTLVVPEDQLRWAGSLGCPRANTLFRFCAKLQAAASSAATAGLSGIVGQAWAVSRARAETMRFTTSAAEALLTRSSRRIPLTASSSPVVKGFRMLAAGFRLQLDCIMLALDSCMAAYHYLGAAFWGMRCCHISLIYARSTDNTCQQRRHDSLSGWRHCTVNAGTELQLYLAAAHAVLAGDGLQVYKGVAGAGAGAEAAEGAVAALEGDLKGAAGKRRIGQIGQAAQLVAGCREGASGRLERLRRASARTCHLIRQCPQRMQLQAP